MYSLPHLRIALLPVRYNVFILKLHYNHVIFILEDAVEEADQLEPDSKPKIDLANLTRYTRPQMLEMRCSSTQKHLERLETLRILNPNKVQVPLEWPANPHLHNLYNLSETDRFLLQLLSLSSVQREDFILKEAEMRKLLVTKRNNLNLPYYDLNDKIRGEYNKCQAEVREKIMAYMQPKQTKPPKQERRGPSASPALSQFSESSPGLSQSPKPFNFNFDVNTPEKPKNRRTKTKKVFEFSSPDYQINEKKGEVQNDVAYKESFLDLFRHSFGPEGISNDFDDIIKYLVDSGKASLLEGELRVNAKNWNEGYVTQKGGNDVLVSTVILRKWALHGDVVKVLVRNNLGEVPAESGLDDTITSGSDLEVASKEKPHPRLGVVISIMEQHHTRETIGTFPMVAGKKRQQSFQPRDTKLPTVLINLNDTQISTHILYMVEITHWLKFQPYG